MSYNGSGTFTINTTGQPVVAGTIISASAFNSLTTDLATGLTTAITKDGQTTTTARITFAQGVTSSLVTDSSSVSTGSIITAGGAGIAKNLYVGVNANVAGTLGVTGVATFSAAPIYSSLTASSAVATDASKGLVSVTNTGTGNNVLATSPTITTPTISSLSSASATALTLQSAGTTAITVDTSQNVGIGTTSPAAKLDVRGSSTFLVNATNPTAWISVDSALTTGSMYNQWNTTSSIGITGTYTNHPHTFVTNNTERMRIDSSGNVGIGTASPSVKLDVSGSVRFGATSSNRILYLGQSSPADNGAGSLEFQVSNTVKNWAIRTNNNVAGALEFCPSTAAGGTTYTTPSMLIDSSGNLLVGTTTSLANGATISGGAGPQLSLNTTTRFTQINFYNTGSQKGFVAFDNTDTRLIIQNASAGVYLSSGATSWTSNSDERKKDIIEPIENATQKLSNLRTVIGKYKTDAEGVRRSFLIAQDVLAVFPEAVDAANADDLGVAYADLIPVLVKAIQELKAELDELKAKVNA